MGSEKEVFQPDTAIVVAEVGDRGLLRADFLDAYDAECSIQESSLATQPALWLGCDSGTHHHVTGKCLARMHLTQKMAADLIPLLQRFVETGRLR